MSQDAEYYFTIIGMCLVLFIAIFGNVITIMATCKFHTLQTNTHILIANLAISDILIASLAAPLRLVDLSGSKWSNKIDNCRVIITLTSFFCNASVLNLTLISIDRAKSIVSPLTYNHAANRTRLTAQILISWVLAIIISFLPYAGYGWIDNGNNSTNGIVEVCRYLTVLDKYYVLFVFITAVFVPFLIMVISYIYILRVAIRHLKRISAVEVSIKRAVHANQEATTNQEIETLPSTINRNTTRNRPRNKTKPTTYRAYLFMKELKAAKMVAIVIGLFVICVVPIVLVDIAEIACGYPCAPKWCVILGVCLSYVNPAANVFAYATISTDYRKAYQKILKSMLFCRNNRI